MSHQIPLIDKCDFQGFYAQTWETYHKIILNVQAQWPVAQNPLCGERP